ncbi:interferon alpha/beta receptor 2 [Fundulus heteroclitus]|uniref:interferon alpha/beta receptor 2 n=1 Tax=Fundulus heteroclitus TaxID=8078 RepID=UPI00165B32D1|nr:interferon alpha/beta receptor 2 [Fundulus heteroclitus]
MSELLWILTWLPLVLTAVAELPAPSNLTVTLEPSGYFLTWQPGAGTPAGTFYRVKTKTSMDARWFPVKDCQCVQEPQSCNLTGPFIHAMEEYNVQVMAHLGNRTSPPAELKRYVPIAHLPPPLINATQCGSIVCVSFLPPSQHHLYIYSLLHYELRIKRSGVEEPEVLTLQSLTAHNETNVAPGQKYCFSLRFSDSQFKMKFNFSEPVCTSIPRNTSSDAAVATVMCLMVMAVIAVFALLYGTGFLCLKRHLMPSVLISIHHRSDEDRIIYSASLPSLLNVRLIAPPVGGTSSSHLFSDQTDECGSETSSGACYTQRLGSNVPSSSSSSSSSLASKPEPASTSCYKETAESSALPPEDLTVTQAQPGAEQNPLRADSLVRVRTERKKEEEEEKKKEEGAVGQDVNLFSLTFGQPEQHNEEEEEEEEVLPDVPEEPASPAPPPVPPAAAASSQTAAAADDDDEEQEEWEYMCRLPSRVSEHLLRSDQG